MTRIRNPFASLEGYNCFGCSPDNQQGLKLSFLEEGEEMIAEWTPSIHFQGFRNILHGGIQATLMDEIASWVTYVKLKKAGVTSSMQVKYIKPVYIDEGNITLRAKVLMLRRNLADIETKLFNQKGELCAEAMITYFTFSEEKSRESYFYPEPEEFYEKQEE